MSRPAAASLLAYALLTAPMVTVACTRTDARPEPPPQTAVRDTALLSPEAARLAAFRIVRAESLAWRDSWSVPARLTLDPSATQSLGAIAEGRVTRVLARIGDRVRDGDVLVAIHSHEMMDALSTLAKATAADAQTAAEYTVAESAAQRAQRLYEIKALSLADLERARAALAQASSARQQSQAELTRARATQSHLVGAGRTPAGIDEHEVLVRSPLNGVVVGLDARPGAVVLVGAPLVTVSRMTSLVLQMQLPERALGAVDLGAAVRFTVPPFPGQWFDARVTRIAPTLDSVSRTLAVQATVSDSAGRLRAEMYASAELLGPPNARTLTVPALAVQALEGDTVVFTSRPRDDGIEIEAVRVRVGRRTAEQIEITAGLVAGTPVIADGAPVAKAELMRRRGGT